MFPQLYPFLGYTKLQIHISKIGWPSKKDADEVGATLNNAKNIMEIYLRSFFKRKEL